MILDCNNISALKFKIVSCIILSMVFGENFFLKITENFVFQAGRPLHEYYLPVDPMERPDHAESLRSRRRILGGTFQFVRGEFRLG
jgi:hypothetical protein